MSESPQDNLFHEKSLKISLTVIPKIREKLRDTPEYLLARNSLILHCSQVHCEETSARNRAIGYNLG